MKKLLLFLALGFCLTNARSLYAINGVNTPPAPAAPRETKFSAARETALGNGLRVIVVERHQLPLLAATVVVRHGAEADHAGLGGTASLAGDLLTKGTETMSAPEIANAIESLGGSIDSVAGWDESTAGVVVMSDKAPAALKILADVVRHPAFQQEEIDRLRSQRLDELRVALQQPGALARFVAERVVYGQSEYGHNAGGTIESLQKIQRADIVGFYQANYRPSESALIFAGDITLEQAKTFAQTLFGDWTGAAPSPNEQRGQGEEKNWKPENVVVDMPEAGQAAVSLVRPSIPRDAPDYYAGLVANAALGNGFVSRLNREVRIKRGLSYGAGSSLDARRYGGNFSAFAQTKNQSAAEVAGLMQAELQKLVTNPVQGDELKSRQAVLTGTFARALETNHGFVSHIAQLVSQNLPLGTLDKFIPAVDAITTDEVTAFAKNHFAVPNATLVVGKASDFLPALKKSLPDVRVIEQSRLDLNRGDLVKK